MNKFLTVLALTASVLLVGCQQEESPQPANQDKKQEQTASQQKKSKWGYELADEVWQDTKSYDSPRMAFLWRRPPHTEGKTDYRYEVWSMKLDHTDLKRRVSYKDVGNGILRTQKTSPDGRYTVFAVSINSRYEKRLYDIKTKTMKVLSHGGVIPSFEWTSDSKTIYYNEAGDFKRYHIPTAKLDILSDKYGERGNAFLVIDNDTKIVFFRSNKMHVRDLKTGKLLFERPYERISEEGVIRTPTGNKFHFQYQSRGHVIVDASKPSYPIIREFDRNFVPRAFDPFDDTLLWRSALSFHDTKTNKRVEIDLTNYYKLQDVGLNTSQTTLYNF
ncbi:TolB family protein [Zooshikella sp. RANM57]|uniref:TolB family protein n=1 Tax=Zooshikella sp. RANM57 TaxID=3425863 RepID=UPI003D6F36A4